ncbi:MAG: hypothetical protein H0W05_04970 [Thermoleophilaceae bacterium]|jgi:hypothetical protein|nr:hypothetical protein [Thermoleophilaceae bacterium]
MLFDLRGRKRTIVRFVYGGLALLFLVGFVGFGVGSDVGSGILGGSHGGGTSGGGHGSDGDSTEDQIETVRETVDSNPDDANAWERLSILSATAALDTESDAGGHGGSPQLADDGLERLGESVFAYEQYVDLRGERRVSPTLAQSAARSYATLNEFPLAVDAQRLAADPRNAQANLVLAQYAAAWGDVAMTENALDRAAAAVPPSQRDAIEQQRSSLRRLAVSRLGSAPGSPVAPPAGGQP